MDHWETAILALIDSRNCIQFPRSTPGYWEAPVLLIPGCRPYYRRALPGRRPRPRISAWTFLFFLIGCSLLGMLISEKPRTCLRPDQRFPLCSVQIPREETMPI